MMEIPGDNLPSDLLRFADKEGVPMTADKSASQRIQTGKLVESWPAPCMRAAI